MKVEQIDHPLVAQKMTALRDVNTNSQDFRRLVDELVTLLAYEATRNLKVEAKSIMTPVASTIGVDIKKPMPVVIPIIRAGLGMLEGMQKILPLAEIGFLGMKRDETTLAIETYANRLPLNLTNRQCYILDPMLATGHTLGASINYLSVLGATDITSINLLAAPEGIKEIERQLTDNVNLTIVTANIDEGLNEKGYIVPGLGDAGDRLYGVVG
ncbi:MAG: uracil phosphoribosyltransferase [Bifidobacteriaceae bacterium]|jgi:uracil phosphoribosyltransferase|nr:uracil phosphoribosyltransferase [Bifidobacteriaceae bacterium]